MVATIAPLSAGKVDYYVNRYYLDGEAEGEWLDTEAGRSFGISGKQVTPRHFQGLLQGYDPRTGAGLVQNAGGARRQVGWDVQFAIHKSFSLLHALVPEAREELESCLKEAAHTAVREVLEGEFLETRRGRGGKIREKVSAPVAGFLHHTNRADEKHLHYHCVLPNVGLRQDGTTGTIVSWNLYDANHALGKAFHARFAELATNRLGIDCEIDPRGLSRVRHFPEEVVEAFSTPSRRIAELAEDGSAKAKEAANLKARPSKRYLPAELIDREMNLRARELGFTAEDARGFLGGSPRVDAHAALGETVDGLLGDVLAGLPDRFAKSDLYELAFQKGAERQLPFAAIKDALLQAESDASLMTPLGRASRQEQFQKSAPGPHQAAETEADAEAESWVPERTVLDAIAEIVSAASLATVSPSEVGPREAVSPARTEVPSQHAPPDAPLEAIVGFTSATTLAPVSRPGIGPAEAGGPGRAGETPHAVFPNPSAPRQESTSGGPVDGAIASAIDRALTVITESEAHFTRNQLEQAVRLKTQNRIVAPGAFEAAIEQALSDPRRVVALGKFRGVPQFTTPEVLEVERRGLKAASALSSRSTPALGLSEIEVALRGARSTLSAEQYDAVGKALAGPDLVLIDARDGGRLHAVQKAILGALKGRDVVCVAQTNSAAQELARSAGAENVASLYKLVKNLDKSAFATLTHHGTMLVHAAFGLPTYPAQSLRLSAGTTVLLDSASLADTRLFSRLLQHAESSRARLIVCGSHRMPSLSLGGLFKELLARAEPGQVARLGERGPQTLETVSSRTHSEATEALIERWAAAALRRPAGHLIVAAANRDVRALNRMAQAQRKQAGRLGFRSIQVRYKVDGTLIKERIYEGDRIVFTGRTDREVINGVFGTVKHIDLVTGRMKVVLDREEKRLFPWEFRRNKTIEFQYRKFRFFQRQIEGFRLGYADNIYRVQNVAVDGNSYVLAGGPDGAPTSVYTRLNLARGTTYLFGEDTSRRFLGQDSDPREKLAAHTVSRELQREQEATPSTVQRLEQGPRTSRLGSDFEMRL